MFDRFIWTLVSRYIKNTLFFLLLKYMDQLSLKENFLLRKHPIIPSPQRVVNSSSNSSRAAILTETNKTVINDVMQCLFKRQSLDLIQITLLILYNCNLKTILSLRLVSKGFQILISHDSKIHTNITSSPLNYKLKVTIPRFQLSKFETSHPFFQIYKQLYQPDLDLHEKIEFAIKENIETCVYLTLSEFFNLPQELYRFKESKLKIILTIFRQEVLPPEHKGGNFLSLLFEKVSSKCPYPLKFLDNVIAINIQNFGMYSSYSEICSHNIAENSNYFSNLRKLTFSCIAMTTRFNLPPIPNLERISILEIGHSMTVSLPNSDCFKSIIKLEIHKISHNTTVNISNAFSNVTHLEINTIEYGVTIIFPESLEKLTTLTLPNFNNLTHLPKSLPNLKNLLLTKMPFLIGILDIGRFNPLNLSYLNIDFDLYTDKNTISQLPDSFSDLTALYIKKIFTTNTFIFPSSLNKLKILSIKEISGTLQLPSCLPNLTSLSLEIYAFQTTKDNAILVLPHSMPNLVHLSLSIKMHFDSKMHLFDPERLQKIFDQPIGVNEYIIELPHSLSNLRTLFINGHKAMLQLRSQSGSKVFIIDGPHDDITRKLLNEVNKRLNRINRPTINTIFNTSPNETRIRIQQQPKYKEIFKITNLSKVSIFERSCYMFPELFSLVSDISDVKSILLLRLISKNFFTFVNWYLSKNKRLTVSFAINDFLKQSHCSQNEIFTPLKEENLMFTRTHHQLTPIQLEANEKARFYNIVSKFNFAKENANIQIIASIENLFHISLILNSISDDQLRITLTINNFSELKSAQNIFSTQEDREIFNKITKLDLSAINISNDNILDDINSLLIIVTQNIDLFPNINTLILGNVETDVNLALPSVVKTLNLGGCMHNCFTLRLLETSKNLENLRIKFIKRNAQLIITDSFKNLKSLRIGPLNNSASCHISNEINNLQVLMIGNMHEYSSIKLPSLLNNLTSLTMGYVNSECSELEFPTSLHKLTNLSLGDIDCSKFVFKPDSLDNLTTLKLSETNENFILPDSLPSLKTMILENVSQHFKWPTYLDNLTSLSIGNLYYKFFILPNSLRKLTTLSVKNINSHTSLILPDSLSNLEVLTIGDLGDRKYLEKLMESEKNDKRPNSLYWAKTTIGHARLVLPHSMNKLTLLILGNIDSTAIIKFPTEFKMLKTVRAGTIENSVVIQQLESIKKIENVEMIYTTPGICGIQ